MGKTYNTSSSTDAIQNPVHCQMSQYWDRGQIKASEQKNHVTYTDQELERLWISRQSWKLEDNGLTTPSKLCGKIISNLLSQTQPNNCSTVGVNILTKVSKPMYHSPLCKSSQERYTGSTSKIRFKRKGKESCQSAEGREITDGDWAPGRRGNWAERKRPKAPGEMAQTGSWCGCT